MPAAAGIREVVEHYTAGKTTEVELSEARVSAAEELVDMIESNEVTPEEMCHTGVLFDTFANVGSLRDKYGSAAPSEASAQELIEAVQSSEFPKITQALIHSKLIPAYETKVKNLSVLYDETESDKRKEDVAGIIDLDEPEPIEEGQGYKMATLKEKDIEIKNQKAGHAIGITREMMMFDRTGGEILRRARDHGRSLGNFQRRWAMQGVQDIAIDATGQAANTVFKYKGSTSALYANTHATVDGQVNDNLLSGAGSVLSLANGQDAIKAADNLLANMKDFWSRELDIMGTVLLVPRQLRTVAHGIINAVGDPGSASLRTNFIRDLGMVGTLFSDAILNTTSTTAWYYGDFQSQFRWQWVRRPFVDDIPGIPLQDIVIIFKAGMHAGFGATDYRFVVKSEGT